MPIHAKITAYKGIIVCDCIAEKSIPDECHLSIDNTGVIGQVFMDTKNNVGISLEALELIKTIPKGHDSLGDFDWFKAGDDKYALGWLGGPKRIMFPLESETSRQFTLGDFVEIPNDSDGAAMAAIDAYHARVIPAED